MRYKDPGHTSDTVVNINNYPVFYHRISENLTILRLFS